MDTGDVKVFVKNNWPYLVGAVVGIFVVWRFMAGRSASSGGSDGYSQYLAGQAAQQQLALQAGLQSAQIELARQESQANAAANTMAAQAALAESAGAAVSGILAQLNQPALHAMRYSAAENVAALDAASRVAVSSFDAQANLIASQSASVASMTNTSGSNITMPWSYSFNKTSSSDGGGDLMSAAMMFI